MLIMGASELFQNFVSNSLDSYDLPWGPTRASIKYHSNWSIQIKSPELQLINIEKEILKVKLTMAFGVSECVRTIHRTGNLGDRD